MKIFMLFAMAIVLATSVLACSCLQMPSVSEALNSSDVVFTGTVSQIYDEPDTGAPNGPSIKKVFFEVDTVWKGEDSGSNGAMKGPYIVFTGKDSAGCGYEFEEDKTYLVYATLNNDGELFTSICSRTRSIGDASEDLTYLGSGVDYENDLDTNSHKSWFDTFVDFVRSLFGGNKRDSKTVGVDESAPPVDE